MGMDEKQLRRTIRGIQGELQELEVKRHNLEDALDSLKRLLPPEPGQVVAQPSTPSNGAFPGTTEAILGLIRQGAGRPVPTQRIRETFQAKGWIKGPEGQDRTQSIYETLRRLNKSKRIIRRGKQGYVLAEPDLVDRARAALAAVGQEEG